MVISMLHTAAEIGIILTIMHLLAGWLKDTPLGGAIAYIYGTGAA